MGFVHNHNHSQTCICIFYIDIRGLSLLIVMPLYLHYIALQLEFLSDPDQMMNN